MEEMDHLLRDLPGQPLPPELSSRVRADFRQRCQRSRKIRQITSILMVTLGSTLLLPELTRLTFALPGSGLGLAQASLSAIRDPQNSLQSIPTLFEQIQSGIGTAFTTTAWAGMIVLAIGALLALGSWMPRPSRSMAV